MSMIGFLAVLECADTRVRSPRPQTRNRDFVSEVLGTAHGCRHTQEPREIRSCSWAPTHATGATTQLFRAHVVAFAICSSPSTAEASPCTHVSGPASGH